MPTQTTNFSFDKPTVGGDGDVWGGYLNDNWDALDALLLDGASVDAGLLGGIAATQYAQRNLDNGFTTTQTIANTAPGLVLQETDAANRKTTLRRQADVLQLYNETGGIEIYGGVVGTPTDLASLKARFGGSLREITYKVAASVGVTGIAAGTFTGLDGITIATFSFHSVKHANGSPQQLVLEASSDGGSTWTALDMDGSLITQTTSARTAYAVADIVGLTNANVASGNNVDGQIIVGNLATRMNVSSSLSVSGILETFNLSGKCAGSINALRFRWASSVNFSAGTISMLAII